jgi:drug/metabolite transporter (DMT)-like permease
VALQLHLVILVLLAALLHATWNAVVKASGDRFLSFTAIRGTGTILGFLALPFVPLPAAESWPYLVASVAIHNFYYVVLLQAYRFGDLSHVYPLARGVAPLTVAVLAAAFAGEVPHTGGAFGIALVSAGIISLMFAQGPPSALGREGDGLKAVLLALGTGLFIAFYTVVDGLGIRAADTSIGYIAWLNAGEGIPFMIAAAATRRPELAPFLKANWKRTTGTGLLTIAAYGLVLFALAQGAMAHISALRETSVLFAAIIGTLVLKESFGRLRVAAAVIIVAGVILMQVAG